MIELRAVLGLGTGRNFVVGKAGSWLAGYIPAVYRGYPFALAPAKDDKQALCIITDSISDTEGEALFDDLGKPSEKVATIINFLSEIARNTSSTHAKCALLEKLDLLEAWPITIRNDETEKGVEGLIRINEEKFNALEDEALLELREQGALPLVFFQLLSMQNLNTIAQLAQAPNTQPILPEELSFDFSNDQGNISFDGFF